MQPPMKRRANSNGTRWRAVRARVLREEDICWICGHHVDKTLRTPHPLSPEVDHVDPVSKGGDLWSRDGLRLSHRRCNRAKSDKSAPAVMPDPVSRVW